MTLHPIPSEFLIYEDNFVFFFISVQSHRQCLFYFLYFLTSSVLDSKICHSKVEEYISRSALKKGKEGTKIAKKLAGLYYITSWFWPRVRARALRGLINTPNGARSAPFPDHRSFVASYKSTNKKLTIVCSRFELAGAAYVQAFPETIATLQVRTPNYDKWHSPWFCTRLVHI